VSNDQSPPVRKVIPYKKGGRRPSPFAEMAFQYSGTALDVAIQQREQDGEALPAEHPAAEETPAESAPTDTSAPEAPQTQSVSHVPEEPQSVSIKVKEEKLPPPLVNTKPDHTEKQPTPRSVRLVSEKKRKSIAHVGTNPDLQAFLDRWKPFLTDTQLGICTFIYNNSTAINQEYCFTSTAKLMAAVSKTERQVKTVLNQLLDWEFIIKGETVINAPHDKRGTYYKLNPAKS